MAKQATPSLTLREGIDVFRQRWPDVQSRSSEAPVILMAAGYRTGSTLLQRMLSRDCLMWGEPYGHGGLLDSVADVFRRIRDFWPEDTFFYKRQDADLRSRTFIANLYPSPQCLLDSYVGFFESLFARPAKESGLDRWGVKTVRYSADHSHLLRLLFPHSKFIFLIRNPYNAFRSYDTICRERGVVWYNRWPDCPLDVRAFSNHWRALTASFLEHQAILGTRLLAYEDLISGQCDLDDLERYAGVRIDREALRTNPGGWPRPKADLDEPQLKIIREHVEPLASQLGYVPGNSTSGPSAFIATRRHQGANDHAIRRAMALHQAGDSREAERLGQEILKNDPEHPGALHFLGLLRLRECDFTAAEAFISQAISRCDTKPVYHNNYGVVLLETGRLKEAEAAFRRALELNDNYADAWSNIGHTQHLIQLPHRHPLWSASSCSIGSAATLTANSWTDNL